MTKYHRYVDSVMGFARCALWLGLLIFAFPPRQAEAASRVYVANLGGSISVYDSATDRIIRTFLFLPPSPLPEAVAITPNGAYAYVTLAATNSVEVIDTATNSSVGNIPVGNEPLGIAFTPDGAFAYVTNAGADSVTVIATATKAIVDTIRLTAGSTPRGIAITPDGTRALVANTGGGTVSFIDTKSHQEICCILQDDPPFINHFTNPTGIAIAPDGSLAYVTEFHRGMAVIDFKGQFAGEPDSDLFDSSAGVGVTKDGKRILITGRGRDGVGLVFAIGLDTVPLALGLLGQIPVGTGPNGIAIEQDGGVYAYVTNAGSGTMSVINTQTLTTVGRDIQVGSAPEGVAILSHNTPIIQFNITFNTLAKFGALFNIMGLLTTFSAPVDDPSIVAAVTWDFYGDGTAIQTTRTTDAQFTYTRAGTFTPTVTVFFKDGTQASSTTTLRVQSPSDAVGTAMSLIDWLRLAPGLTNSLMSELDAASRSLTAASYHAACGQIQASENELRALVQSGQLDEAAASPTIGEMKAIQVSIGCS